MKRVFGLFEAVFDISYLVLATMIALFLLGVSDETIRTLAGIMALVLVAGDAFHLIPRINAIVTGREEQLKRALGRGKQIASITMTLFYVLLWQIGVLAFSPGNILAWSYLLYALALIRILLCLFPQNKWEERYPPVNWSVWRNIPFFLQGTLVAVLFFVYRNTVQSLSNVWLAIAMSFVFYFPVVIFANKRPKVGMLMLPKTCMYLWLLTICLSL